MEANTNQEVFLVNERNKSQFICLLDQYLQDNANIVHHSSRDADTLIVQCVLQYTSQRQEVDVIADVQQVQQGMADAIATIHVMACGMLCCRLSLPLLSSQP